MFAFKISHSVRDFMPNFTIDFSPFAARIRPGKRQEENISKKAKIPSLKNPSIMGVSSAGSSNNSTRLVVLLISYLIYGELEKDLIKSKNIFLVQSRIIQAVKK